MEVLENESFRLSHVVWQKRYFNPHSKKDIQEYKYFMDNARWKNGCPFNIEWPYLTVTEMIRSKLIETHIERIIKDAG